MTKKDDKKFLSVTDILTVDDRPIEAVHVPEWGGWVRVRGLSGTQRTEFEAAIMQIDGKGKSSNIDLTELRERLVVATVVNEDGTPLFKMAHVQKLGQKSAIALDRIFQVAQRLSGLSDDDVDELTENFTPAPAEHSGSN